MSFMNTRVAIGLKGLALAVVGCGLASFVALAAFVIHGITHPIVGCSSSNVGQIAKTYLSYAKAGGSPRTLTVPPGSTAHAAAFILAQKGGLNNARLWISPPTHLQSQQIPNVVIEGDIATATELSPAFAQSTLLYEFAANLSVNAPPSTTPVNWSRGLRFDGTWAPDSPDKGKGGYIAFLDGHVQWFDKARPPAEIRSSNTAPQSPPWTSARPCRWVQ